jgi:hypothetical protein
MPLSVTVFKSGSDGTRTRDLRRDRPASARRSSSPPDRLDAASVLQASAFLSDVTVFRPMQRPWANLARNLHLGGIRRNACTESRRLITRRSQVQILPPLLESQLCESSVRVSCACQPRSIVGSDRSPARAAPCRRAKAEGPQHQRLEVRPRGRPPWRLGFDPLAVAQRDERIEKGFAGLAASTRGCGRRPRCCCHPGPRRTPRSSSRGSARGLPAGPRPCRRH